MGLKFDEFGKLYSKINLISIHTRNSGLICQIFFHQTDLLVDLPNFSPANFLLFMVVDTVRKCSSCNHLEEKFLQNSCKLHTRV